MNIRPRLECRKSRWIYPALVGCLAVGIIFVGVALASQSVRTAVRPTSGADAVAHASDRWLERSHVSSERSSPEPTVLSRSRPVTLDIKAIGVHSVLNEVGLN